MVQRQSRHLFLLVFCFATITIFLFYYKEPVAVLLSKSAPSLNTAPLNATPLNAAPLNAAPAWNPASSLISPPANNITKSFVVASQKKDNTDWIDKHLPDWKYVRYITDEPKGKYNVPKNKGNEAMVYLTYIIDHYENLPDLVVFIHADRFQWHNDDPLWDNAYLLKNLQIPHLLSQPYTNLRCVWTLGCPSDIKGINAIIPTYLDPHDDHLKHHLTFQYAVAFPLLFPDEPIPAHVSVPCCAQFATLRSSILSRPLYQYIAIRKWLLDTELENDISGRIFEFSWHILFRAPAFSCPDAKGCYCKLYGQCDVQECDGERCGNRWDWPPGRDWPKKWPEEGWNGEMRSSAEVEKIRRLGKADKPPEKEEKSV